MSGTSSKSTVVAIRLPNDVVDVIRQRAEARGCSNLADYLRPRIISDLTRKHKRNDARQRGSETSNEDRELVASSPLPTTTIDNLPA
jgi:hypothetical protein